MDLDLERIETYRGHKIAVHAIEMRPNGWRWPYLIDGRVTSMSRGAFLPSAEAALNQGLAAARVRVDGMVG